MESVIFGIIATITLVGVGLLVFTARSALVRSINQNDVAIRDALATLQGWTQARQDLDRRTADSIGRIERVLAGSKSRGNAGENLVAQILEQLPPEWQARNVSFDNKVVEFGLRLPNGRIVPIDSKWPAVEILDQLGTCDNQRQQQALVKKIRDAVERQALDLEKYLDPDRTMGFGIAVVPDAVFALCGTAQGTMARKRIVVLSHSMMVPYLLLVVQTTLATSHTWEMAEATHMIQRALAGLEAMQQEIERRFSAAVADLDQSRSTLRGQLSRARSDLSSLLLPTTPAIPSTENELIPVLNQPAAHPPNRGIV